MAHVLLLCRRLAAAVFAPSFKSSRPYCADTYVLLHPLEKPAQLPTVPRNVAHAVATAAAVHKQLECMGLCHVVSLLKTRGYTVQPP